MAVELAGKLRANSPQHVGCLLRLARSIVAQGRIKEGIGHFRECWDRIAGLPIQLQQGYYRLRSECGQQMSRAFASLGNHVEAVKYSGMALESVEWGCRNEDIAFQDETVYPHLCTHVETQIKAGPTVADIATLAQSQARLVQIVIRRYVSPAPFEKIDVIVSSVSLLRPPVSLVRMARMLPMRAACEVYLIYRAPFTASILLHANVHNHFRVSKHARYIQVRTQREEKRRRDTTRGSHIRGALWAAWTPGGESVWRGRVY